MAFRKRRSFKEINCEYWKILDARVNYVNDNTHVRLGLYKDRAARLENVANDVHSHHRTLGKALADREAMYTALKVPVLDPETGEPLPGDINFFTDAEDVLEVVASAVSGL